VQEHVSFCTRCHETLADYRRFDALLADLPRVGPQVSLRERIFSSPDYLELTGTTGIPLLPDIRRSRRFSPEARAMIRPVPDLPASPTQPALLGKRLTLPQKPGRQDRQTPAKQQTRPRLVALPGGLQETKPLRPIQTRTHTSRRVVVGVRLMQLAIAVCVLLTLGVGSLIGWNAWQQQHAVVPGGITPPQGLRQGGPLPAGTRFVYLHDGSLWSGSLEGTSLPVQLTSSQVDVAAHWSVRPAFSGRIAGNMLAYIDVKQGRVHVIRSDGQRDIALTQPLLAQPSTNASWNTAVGQAILTSLSWSPDGTKLAFLAAPTGIPHLYIYTVETAHLELFALPVQAGVLSLNWSPDTNTSAITESFGTPGHVQAIVLQLLNKGTAQTLLSGDYTQAIYTRMDEYGMGRWLLLSRTGDISTLDLDGTTHIFAQNTSARVISWSSKGSYISYFQDSGNGVGIYHVINRMTGSDTVVATHVASTPLPVWSSDEQTLLYSEGTSIIVMHDAANKRISFAAPIVQIMWSAETPDQALVVLQDGRVYQLDIAHGTTMFDKALHLTTSIAWTEIP
jgi:hypothetical protein